MFPVDFAAVGNSVFLLLNWLYIIGTRKTNIISQAGLVVASFWTESDDCHYCPADKKKTTGVFHVQNICLYSVLVSLEMLSIPVNFQPSFDRRKELQIFVTVAQTDKKRLKFKTPQMRISLLFCFQLAQKPWR